MTHLRFVGWAMSLSSGKNGGQILQGSLEICPNPWPEHPARWDRIALKLFYNMQLVVEIRNHDWLVVWTATPLKNIRVKVNWDDEIPNVWKNKFCSKPPTRWGVVILGSQERKTWKTIENLSIGDISAIPCIVAWGQKDVVQYVYKPIELVWYIHEIASS